MMAERRDTRLMQGFTLEAEGGVDGNVV